MKVAILGGGGCFALNFARYCHMVGVNCFGVGRSAPKHPAFWLAPPGYEYHRAHLVNEMDRAVNLILDRHPDVIVNFAAQGEGAHSFGKYAPDFYMTNTYGLAEFVRRILDSGIHFVHIGTSEVYGSVEYPSKESDATYPSSPYAISKLAFEQHLRVMHKRFGFRVNIIRPSNCYTPGQQLHRIIPRAIVCALTGDTLSLHGGGLAQKSYLHADDLSRAIMDVIERGRSGEIYNVGPSGPVTIRSIVEQIAWMCEKEVSAFVVDTSDRLGQDAKYWLDSSKLAQHTGWTQTIGMQRGLREMVDWVREFPDLLTMTREYRHAA